VLIYGFLFLLGDFIIVELIVDISLFARYQTPGHDDAGT
jgi:hypothetical protein